MLFTAILWVFMCHECLGTGEYQTQPPHVLACPWCFGSGVFLGPADIHLNSNVMP